MDYKLAMMNCLMLQDKMNSTVNQDWKEAGNDWEMATIVEMGEFMEHFGYKWWKKTEPDFNQAFIELVDVFHFTLSRSIIQGDTVEELAEEIGYAVSTISNAASTTNQLVKGIVNAVSETADWELEKGVDTQRVIRCLVHLVYRCGKTIEDFFAAYIGKNTLNIFRQKNGYKSGTYIKMWNGKEDNEVMYELIQKDPVLGIDFDLLYDALSTEYEKL